MEPSATTAGGRLHAVHARAAPLHRRGLGGRVRSWRHGLAKKLAARRRWRRWTCSSARSSSRQRPGAPSGPGGAVRATAAALRRRGAGRGEARASRARRGAGGPRGAPPGPLARRAPRARARHRRRARARALRRLVRALPPLGRARAGPPRHASRRRGAPALRRRAWASTSCTCRRSTPSAAPSARGGTTRLDRRPRRRREPVGHRRRRGRAHGDPPASSARSTTSDRLVAARAASSGSSSRSTSPSSARPITPGSASTRSGSGTGPTAPSSTPRTRPRSTRTSTRSTSRRRRLARAVGGAARRRRSSGSTRACASSASTTRTPSRSASGSGSSREVRRAHPDVDLPRRGVHPAEGDVRSWRRSASRSRTPTSPGATRSGSSTEYFTELTQDRVREYIRPNFWPNTPDILPEYLQYGGRAGVPGAARPRGDARRELRHLRPRLRADARARAVRPGREEYLDSEKYELRHWDLERPDALARLHRAGEPRSAARTRRSTSNAALAFFHDRQRAAPRLLEVDATTSPNLVLVVVNLDPHHVQSGWLELPLEGLGLAPGRAVPGARPARRWPLPLARRAELRRARPAHRARADLPDPPQACAPSATSTTSCDQWPSARPAREDDAMRAPGAGRRAELRGSLARGRGRARSSRRSSRATSRAGAGSAGRRAAPRVRAPRRRVPIADRPRRRVALLRRSRYGEGEPETVRAAARLRRAASGPRALRRRTRRRDRSLATRRRRGVF